MGPDKDQLLSGHSQTTKTQKAHPSGWALHLIDAWQFPTLTWGDPTLPSALRRFTSEFGMGSGGTTALLPPGKFCLICIRLKIFSQIRQNIFGVVRLSLTVH